MAVLREIIVDGDVAYVKLTRGYVSVIDAADANLAEGINWQSLKSHRTVYAVCGNAEAEGRKAISLHRLLMGGPGGLQVDHIDGDGLNNRRSNLRLATHSQNARNAQKRADNSSGFKCVSFHKRVGKWRAYIAVCGKISSLGYYRTPEQAHAAYCAASAEMHREFWRTC